MASFAQRLTLALKALSMSRGRLASELGVDKSLVGRWASGTIRPSAHNLERLTHLLASKQVGFSLLDWERELPDFAALFGADYLGSHGAALSSPDLPRQLLEVARNEITSKGSDYEGFWRATFPGTVFFQIRGMIRRENDGSLRVVVGSAEAVFSGSILPVDGQLFATLTDSARHLPAYMILNVVYAPKAILLDGLMITASNALGHPEACPILAERIGDLSGDRTADDAHLRALLEKSWVAEGDSQPADAIKEHLLRDTGPTAAAGGGELLLSAVPRESLMRIAFGQTNDVAKSPTKTKSSQAEGPFGTSDRDNRPTVQ